MICLADMPTCSVNVKDLIKEVIYTVQGLFSTEYEFEYKKEIIFEVFLKT